MSNAPLLQAIDISRSFKMGPRRLDVLHDVSLSISEGDVWGITGMSGAGKSTFLHIIGGLDRPTAGRVLFNGRDLYAMRDRERSGIRAASIGFVFQAYHLLPELTVLENTFLPALSRHGAFLRGRAIRAKALDLLAKVGLADRAAHRPNELSGGEQQRAAIARALMNDPGILLADEPTGNLDSQTGADVLDLLFGLVQQQQLTLVMVTHNEQVAARCSHRLELRDGRIAGA